MKLLIASDIHGSAYYAEKLLNMVNIEMPDKIILLGDLLYHGPRNDLPKDYDPKKVIDILNGIKEKLICVRGNCDTEVDQMVLSFPILADFSAVFVDGYSIYLSHGHVYNKEKPLPLSEGDIFISGHTHVPVSEKINNILFLNPGSVSIPKENSPNSYMIYENQKFSWKDLTGKEYMETNI